MKVKITSDQDLIVWQMSSQFSKEMSLLIKNFPKREIWELSDDLLRAARSIPANIAEGWGRIFPKEKISFYNISKGSAEECGNHLIEALNNQYITPEQNKKYQSKLYVIKIKLTNLIMAIYKYVTSTRSSNSFLDKSATIITSGAERRTSSRRRISSIRRSSSRRRTTNSEGM